MMKAFEIFSEKKKGQNGRRKFKVILHKIFPDSCVDEANQVGTEFNSNGITWIREYCEKALPSIKGMSIRCEFLDEERTELCGHGMTGIIDDVPIFENAVMIGKFEEGYIDMVTDEDGNEFMACIGVGEIDSSCYHNFCEKLDEYFANGISIEGSVEIMHTEENAGIVYKYGYKEKGRIPTEFIYSGYALLGVAPSDKNAKLIELNEIQKEDLDKMTEAEIKALVEQCVRECSKVDEEMQKCREECAAAVAEAESRCKTVTDEKNSLMVSSEAIQKALDDLQAEFKDLDVKYQQLWAERDALEKELGKAKARERIGELNAAIAGFTDDEREYANAEIKAFEEKPVESEINSVVTKIYEGIGKKAKEAADAAVTAEQNAAAQAGFDDIFSVVETPANNLEDTNIF